MATQHAKVVCISGGPRGLTAHEIREALDASREKGETTIIDWSIEDK